MQAGILDERAGGPVVDAVVADPNLSERHKQVLLEVYESFRREHREQSTQAPATVDAAAAQSGKE